MIFHLLLQRQLLEGPLILNNLENINAELIEMKIPQNERLVRLNNIARKQMEILKKGKVFQEMRILNQVQILFFMILLLLQYQ